jgi:hypothetical protein
MRHASPRFHSILSARAAPLDASTLSSIRAAGVEFSRPPLSSAPSKTRLVGQGLRRRKAPWTPSDNGVGCYNRAMESGRLGRRMAGKLPLTAVAVLSGLLVAGLATARAADPAFCKPYARAALVQVRQGLASPRCGAGLQGTRWSTEFSVHYESCLEASSIAIAVERDARTKLLRGCTDR